MFAQNSDETRGQKAETCARNKAAFEGADSAVLEQTLGKMFSSAQYIGTHRFENPGPRRAKVEALNNASKLTIY